MFLPSNITLQFGDSGDYVAELQRRLVGRQCLARGLITSFYDAPTVSAVRTFQIASGLTGDGVAGPETLRRLNTFFTEDAEGTKQDSTEQATSRGPTLEQSMNLQIIEQQVQQQKELEKQIELGAAASQQQVEIQQTQIDQTKDLQQQRDLDRNLAREQMQAREQQQNKDQQIGQRVELDARSAQFFQAQAQDQRAFIDKPMAKSLDDLAAKPEQDIGGKDRGPELSRDPTEGKALQQAPEKSTPGISVPKDLGTDKKPEISPTVAPTSPGADLSKPAAPSVSPPAQAQVLTMSPEMNRISQQMEAKLPPHVIEEVKQVGVVMLNQGVKQTQMTGEIASPERTPGMEERQAAVGGVGR